ncbi:glycosyltransferase family 2 protein [uncultured Bacteroides sp.]|uniref:glycosyltransferase family 2 protein n=1 Tax=uncultured Bacteroides sp. TaxID=162156 RepID=UPI002AAB7CB3|nr:glycosyltransferase family 2 protein [uncultured Bacteroides sp.]
MENPLISIIVPVYNVEAYLIKCLDSILCQTLKEIEIILVDNGSTDSSFDICKEYQKKDERIKTIRLPFPDLSSARNAGINVAKAPYISFIDSDDWIDNDMFSLLYSAIKNYNADISICSFYEESDSHIIPKNKKVKNSGEVFTYSKDDALKKILLDKGIKSYVWNKLYKKELFNFYRFPEGVLYEDYSTIYKCFSLAENVVQVDLAKYHYLQRSNSIIHIVNPKARYHFFLANYNRYFFAKEQKIFGQDSYKFNTLTVKRTIRQVKYVLSCSQENNVEEYICEMRMKLKDFLDIPITKMNLKYYLRLRKVIYFWPFYSFSIFGYKNVFVYKKACGALSALASFLPNAK